MISVELAWDHENSQLMVCVTGPDGEQAATATEFPKDAMPDWHFSGENGSRRLRYLSHSINETFKQLEKPKIVVP